MVTNQAMNDADDDDALHTQTSVYHEESLSVDSWVRPTQPVVTLCSDTVMELLSLWQNLDTTLTAFL